jgi:hypothetical protein
MITNTGKDIIAKYLIGQAPAYASYMALGCGPKALAPSYNLTESDYTAFSNKQNLDFEVFRVPVTSRGYVTEDGQSKIVFTAELPPEQRYEITEVGIYSAKSNPSAAGRDSRIIYTFTNSEAWEYHSKNKAVGLAPVVTSPLWGTGANTGIIKAPEAPLPPVIRASSDNAIFEDGSRLLRNERCRFLSNMIMLPGNMSYLEQDSVSGVMAPKADLDNTEEGYRGSHIHLSGINLNFNTNSAEDELRLAYSVISTTSNNALDPKRVMILIEFSSDDTAQSTTYAKFQINDTNFTQLIQNQNRYRIASVKLEDLVKTSDFGWGSVKLVKIYATVFVTDPGNPAQEIPSSEYYVALDGLRLENVSSINPLYGLTGYSKVQTEDSLPVIKNSNTSSLVEFRFGMDVV